jgi:hypothetical protein
MVNRRAHPRCLRSLLVLIALGIPSLAARAGPPQSTNTQDVGPLSPQWCLLPRTPLSPALQTGDAQPMAEWTEQQLTGSAQTGRSNPSETESTSAFAGSQPATGPRSQGVLPAGPLLFQDYDVPQTTDQGPPPTASPAVVWQRVSQAITALKTELKFPSLLPRTPLSRAPWTEDPQPAAEQTQDQAAGSAQTEGLKLNEMRSGSAFAASQLAPVSPSDAMKSRGQSQAQGYDGLRATDQEPSLTIPSPEVWQKVSQAITILHVEPTFPSLLPRSPLSRELWTHESQPVLRQAKKEETGKKEGEETTSFPSTPVLLASGMSPSDQPQAQGQKESPTKGPGQDTAVSQNPSERSPSVKTPGGEFEAPAHDGPKTPTHGQAPAASQTVPAHPSSAPSQNVQPTPQGYRGPSTTDHTSKLSLQGSASDSPIAPGGRQTLRDPFKLPPPPRPEEEKQGEKDDPKLPGNRPPGSRGLLVEQLRLKGVVRDGATQKMIAVVTTNNNRAYFLREGEAVYDGVVSKITSDAVYFKGNIFDAKREARSREVVKTLSVVSEK